MKLLLGLLCAVYATSAFGIDIGRLPSQWYVLPENAENLQMAEEEASDLEFLRYRRSPLYVERSLEKIYKNTVLSLDQSEETLGRRDPPPNAPDDWVPWHLKEMIMDLGVSLQGTVGVLTSKGELAAEVYWKRTEENLERLNLQNSVEDLEDAAPSSDLEIVEGMSTKELKERLNPIVRTVMATGKIEAQHQGRVAEGLEKVATQLAEVMTGINGGNSTHWVVDGFRLDVSISGSGKVHAGISVGAAVRLSFNWKPRSASFVPENETDAQRNMRKLLLGIAQDLETMSEEQVASTGFSLKKLRLGIGGFISAKFGIAKGKIDAAGYVYLKKQSTRVSNGPTIVVDDVVPMVEEDSKPSVQAFARRNGIPMSRWTDPDSGAEKIVYYMSRSRFRRGLQRAVDMGKVFTVRAKRSDGRNWYIYKVKPKFELSLMGVAGVVTIGGKVSLELEYKRS